MVDIQTCRFCHKASFEDRRPMVRYGARHSAHWECKFDSLKDREARIAFVQSLPKYKVLASISDNSDDKTGIIAFLKSAIGQE